MRVLVTGATSDTGRRLAGHLVAAGHEVACLVRRPGSAPAGCREHRGSIPEPGAPWAPEHLAALDRAAAGARVAFALTHVRYAPAVVERARAAGVERTVCVSSQRRFTRWPDAAAASVAAAEASLVAIEGGWVGLRATMIYGGGRDRNIARLLDLVRRWPLVPLPAGGRHRIQPLFVGDLEAALLAAAEAPGVGGSILDLAGPRPLSVREAAATMARLLSKRRVFVPVPLGLAIRLASLLRPALAAAVRRFGEDRVAEIGEAQRRLGFSPRPFEQGLAEMLRSEGSAGL
jgi:nucleoside-diphosphate-sugar epimerase